MTPVCAFNDGPELSRYLFGEASADEKRRVEAHLANCSACRQELGAFERTVSLVRASEGGGARLDPRARERVLAAARTAVTNRPPRLLTLRPYVLSSVAALVLVGLTLLIVDHTRHQAALPASDREFRDELMAARSQTAAEGATVAKDAQKLEALGYLGGKSQKETTRLAFDQRQGAEVLSVTVAESKSAAEVPAAEVTPAQSPVAQSVAMQSPVAQSSEDQSPEDKVEGDKALDGATYRERSETAAAAPAPEKAREDGASKATAAGGSRSGSGGAVEAAKTAPARAFAPPSDTGEARGALKKNRDALDNAVRGSRSKEEEANFNEAPAAAEVPLPSKPQLEARLHLGATSLATRAGDDSTRTDADEKQKRDDENGRAPSEGDEDRKEAVGREIDRLFGDLERRPGETPSMMIFRYWGDNAFIEASETPQSTFGMDVDTASYTLARSYLTQGLPPPREAVRTEEFVNYFRSAIPAPEQGTFRIQAEIAPSPFAEPDHLLLKIGLKAKDVAKAERRPCALTFVVDVSGSMNEGNRLELVKESLKLLVGALDEQDKIGLAAFSSHATKLLDPVSVAQKERILGAIESLHAEGSTNVDSGLTMGYEMAAGARIDKGNNRVILCSDGVANTGVTDQTQMLANVARYRAEGILLNCVGVGMGNHNDELLEQLADRGDGQCLYVDRLAEARRAFQDNLTATLQTVARDAKIQVEFDPAHVLRYRQLGYENRALRNQDFRNDQVDAGDVGAGHEIVALYELKLRPETSGRLADIRVRFKDVDVPAEVSEIHRTVDSGEVKSSFAAANPRFQLSAVAAEFAELLRESYWAHSHSLAGLFPLAEGVARSLPDDHDVSELCALIRGAAELKTSQGDDLARAIDQVKRNLYQRTQLVGQADAAIERELIKLTARNEELRRTIQQLLEKR